MLDRSRKPAAIKRLEGGTSKWGRGHRAINDGPKAIGRPQAGKTMSPHALTIWKRLVACMPLSVYQATDEFVMQAFCEAVASHQHACEMIAKDGEVSTGHAGQPTVSPWVKIQGDRARLIMSLASRLGLDPMARQNIQAEQEAADPFLIQ